MRLCACCGNLTDSQIGFYEEVKRVHWGGRRNGNVEYDEKKVYFFCSEQHRTDFMAANEDFGFETQTDRWGKDGEE